MSFLSTLAGWVKTAVSFITAPPLPSPGSTLADIIMSETRDYGPSPVTGGHLKKIDRSTAEIVADLILKEAYKAGESAAFIAAGICGESCFDPTAIDPNNQDGKPGETDHQKFLHTDFGIGQFDGNILVAEPELKGLSDADIQAKAEDITWAIPHFCAIVAGNRKAVMYAVEKAPDLLDNIPNRDPEIIIAQAYNSGLSGALYQAKNNGKFTYGIKWVQKAAEYHQILNKEVTSYEQNSSNPGPSTNS
jgi:hypothetical protein